VVKKVDNILKKEKEDDERNTQQNEKRMKQALNNADQNQLLVNVIKEVVHKEVEHDDIDDDMGDQGDQGGKGRQIGPSFEI
jgi:hypothetical protein